MAVVIKSIEERLEPNLFDSEVCRTCLSTGASVPLFEPFEEQGGSLELPALLLAVAGVAAGSGDGLPAALCPRCAAELRAAARYQRRARDSDRRLREARGLANVAEDEVSSPSPVAVEEQAPSASLKRKRRAMGPQKCAQCGLVTASVSALRSHARVHSGARPFRCEDCGRAFGASGNLRRHRARHGPRERRFVCDQCGRAFYRASDIVAHMRTHSGERPFACGRCPRRFSQAASLSRHERAHDGTRRHACTRCDKRFTDRDLLRKHQLVHSERRDFVCELCGKAFKSRTALKAHVDLHGDERRHVCGECGRAFAVKGNLVKHVQRVHRADSATEPGSVPCGQCGLVFASRGGRGAHCRAVHSPPLPCPACPATFPLPRMLRHHQLKAHGPAPPLPCPAPACPRRFYRASDRSRHHRAAHPAPSIPSADQSDQKLSNKDSNLADNTNFSPDACLNIYANVLS